MSALDPVAMFLEAAKQLEPLFNEGRICDPEVDRVLNSIPFEGRGLQFSREDGSTFAGRADLGWQRRPGDDR
jgi:hypothetical protein